MNILKYQLVANGDAGVSILFDAPISESLSRKIHWLAQYCEQELNSVVSDIIPGYQSLTLVHRPQAQVHKRITAGLELLLKGDIPHTDYRSNLITIPVCYDVDYAPDLHFLAEYCGLTQQSVIAQHSEQEYFIHMLGFSPGFLYLGGLDNALRCPRKSVPSSQVPAGSVGIGGNQTGIYPQATPGGWQIIGRTPLSLFNPLFSEPCIAKPMDKVKFKVIDAKQFIDMEKATT